MAEKAGIIVSSELRDNNLRAAMRHLPQAPANGQFAGRLMRLAALTPQRGRELAMESPANPLRFAWALVGFTVGVALIFLCLLPLQARIGSARATQRMMVSFSSMTFDPLENAATQIYGEAGEDRK
ncbi:hypothetical protein IT570_01640 [Candidatus Sumerlaeota bacterium]|nr:hypothetical protein [Candidatus Sumerlaeota bacterium]